MDLRVIAKFISDITGKNFVFDKRIRDKVTVFSPTEVTPEEAYRLFETVLKIHGYTTVPGEGVINIVSSQQARTMDVGNQVIPARSGPGKDDRIVTR